ncbi:DNA topoisomerase 3 [Lactobacillus salivarius]|uniref:type IA DNA topoisomerase n=1 Tax=Ligilactobacillus salivarius TaxID=1624 RepID=UPI0015C5A577|nr:type IA DNA topoisomerase [Ligilactobacillus salivarius]NXZ95802.1 DNA topoisomerase 3 [Ligilactobacillus salivarius]NYA68798.1 DNA topoisomerase 3 [Ligilactobacillus salivarius]NYA73109.1 DNA topoisomerase 3 [Ligilactobacillus salivarius]
MTTVILAEKPSQAKNYIESFNSYEKYDGYFKVEDPIFNDETFVTYCFGHLVTLAKPEYYNPDYAKSWNLKQLPIFPTAFHFEVAEGKHKQFNIVRELLNKANTIVIATDSDREGENIAWSILNQVHITNQQKNIKRLWINSLEKSVVLEGFKNLKDDEDYYNFFVEAQTRQLSDWLVGMNLTRLFTCVLGQQGIRSTFSVGRVQTPTLNLVYERDLAIKNFKSVPYFEVESEILTDSEKFVSKLTPSKQFENESNLITFIENNDAQKGLQDGYIQSVEKKRKNSASPRLFSLSSLQSEVNRRYKATASETLKAVQSLYEKKLLSYPRSDCNYITEAEFAYLKENIDNYAILFNKDVSLFTQIEPDKRYVNNKKVQEHYAIIPTRNIPTTEQIQSFNKLELQIYTLVVATTLAMFMEPYLYDETIIITKVGNLTFKASGQIPISKGWHEMIKVTENEKHLPEVIEGQVVKAYLVSVEKKTSSPKPFTEGTLITAMKTAGKTLDDKEAQSILKDVEGIGTEATRANIIDELKKKEYLVISKNKLHVSPKGSILCQAAASSQTLVSASMTAEWEKKLKLIGHGEFEQKQFLANVKQFIQELVGDVPTKLKDNQNLVTQIKENSNNNNKIIGTCPLCKKGKIMYRENKKEPRRSFYGCNRYKEGCKFGFSQIIAGKKLTNNNAKELIEKGKTKKINGFKKKDGGSFAAALKLDLTADRNKVIFDFSKK